MFLNIEQRINAFSLLGQRFLQIARAIKEKNPLKLESEAALQMYENAVESPLMNPWFTIENVRQSIESLGLMLELGKIKNWLASYRKIREAEINPKTIAVIMAGNIPLVGFHDFLSVLISGNKILAKLSSQDKSLPVAAANLLKEIEPGFSPYIYFTEGIISAFDAVIATGSNNSSRYFHYYFSKVPNIIRGNRSSAAVITEKEDLNELKLLGNDLFSYFGLGCRNVSLVFLPAGFDIKRLEIAFKEYGNLMSENNKYMNNYDYQKAVFLVNKLPFVDSGYYLMRENLQIFSPVSVINYRFYHDIKEAEQFLSFNKDNLQCIVGGKSFKSKHFPVIPLGKGQQPELWDYADGADTMEFLQNL